MNMRENTTKMTFKQRIASLIPTKRRLIQLYAALLTNANIKGFFTGQIYKGPLKTVCSPGLNCYSCPGAAGACPLGALQNAIPHRKLQGLICRTVGVGHHMDAHHLIGKFLLLLSQPCPCCQPAQNPKQQCHFPCL